MAMATTNPTQESLWQPPLSRRRPMSSRHSLPIPSVTGAENGYLDANNTTILPLIASYGSTFTTNFQIIYTGVFVSILPLFLVYLALRRLFIRSIMAGAVKG